MISDLIGHIKALPPLPETLQKMQLVLAAPEVDIGALVRLVEADPMLCADLLKAANSPLYGSAREVRTIQQAVMIFGTAMIRGFVSAIMIRKAVPGDLSPYGMSVAQLGELSALQSAFAARWMQRVSPGMVPLVQSAAFLMESGKLIIAQELIRSENAAAFSEKLREVTVDEAERAFVGMTSCEASAMIFESWHFDAAFVSLLRAVYAPMEAEPHAILPAQMLHVVRELFGVTSLQTGPAIERAEAALDLFGFEKTAFRHALADLHAVDGSPS